MKIKSMIAALAASALTLSALAVTASAAITNANSGDKYMLSVVSESGNNLPEGCKLSDVYGLEAKLSKTAGEGENCIGALCWQSDNNEWKQEEFSQPGGKKNIIIGDDGVVKYVADAPLFPEGETWGKVFVAEWDWDATAEGGDDHQIDFDVEYFKLLDKDGNELVAKAAEETTTEAPATTTTVTTTTADGKTTTTTAAAKKADSTKTGDAGVGVVIAALGLAGAAAYTARKRH